MLLAHPEIILLVVTLLGFFIRANWFGKEDGFFFPTTVKPEEESKFDWSDDQLSLGKPNCMDTPTLIEWIQRQIEPKEETVIRHEALQATRDIDSMFLIKLKETMTPNEMRQIRDNFRACKYDNRLAIIPSGADLQLIEKELR